MLKIPYLNCEAIFNKIGLKGIEISRKDVGASFEPRLQIDYEIRNSDGDLNSFYRRLIIFEKDFETIVVDKGNSYRELPAD